jgi:phage baseplate assembly protein V
MSALNPAELHRLIQNLVRIGIIEAVDASRCLCRVKIGELTTGWLDMPVDIGANYKHWRPLRVGTQVLLACPGGDVSAGVIVAMLFSNDLAAPASDEQLDMVEFDDGTQLQYNSQSHQLSINCTGAVSISCTDATITAAGSAKVEASGDVSLSGTSITLQGGAAGGMVCQSHVCAFTGSPHPQASTTITGGN